MWVFCRLTQAFWPVRRGFGDCPRFLFVTNILLRHRSGNEALDSSHTAGTVVSLLQEMPSYFFRCSRLMHWGKGFCSSRLADSEAKSQAVLLALTKREGTQCLWAGDPCWEERHPLQRMCPRGLLSSPRNMCRWSWEAVVYGGAPSCSRHGVCQSND